MRFINFSKKPNLNHPILIAGFEGWPNAGCISSDVLSFLKKGLGVKKFAEVNPDIFHKYSNNRPYAKIDGGEVKYLLFSPYEFFYKKSTSLPGSDPFPRKRTTAPMETVYPIFPQISN